MKLAALLAALTLTACSFTLMDHLPRHTHADVAAGGPPCDRSSKLALIDLSLGVALAFVAVTTRDEGTIGHDVSAAAVPTSTMYVISAIYGESWAMSCRHASAAR
jgi:hypothetical protein